MRKLRARKAMTWREFGRRTTAITLSMVMAFQPALLAAQSITVVGADDGPRPVVDEAANGTPVINIHTPNDAGVSHNVFSEFSADDLILNNSATNTSTTLAGFIEGNPNLSPDEAAQLWIGEVVGGSTSLLTGAIEVAGPQMDVILANEFGITCDGCGFINTGRATLSTGAPMFAADGSFAGFDVRQGVVRVGPGGLNPEDRFASGDTSRVDVIARAAEIYGAMRGTELNVVTGANVVAYDWSYDPTTGAMTGITPQAGTGSAPLLAVDMSALGGMYANAIRMVATEAGVGVRLHGEMASSGDIAISSSGRLTLGAPSGGSDPQIRASRNVQIAAAGPVVLSGAITSEDGALIDISSQDTITADGSIAGGTVALQGAGLVAISGAIEAQQTLAAESLTAGLAVQAGGQIAAADIDLTAATDLTIGGIVSATATTDLIAGTTLTSQAGSEIHGDLITLSAAEIITGGIVSADTQLTAAAGANGFTNSGTLSAPSMALSTGAGFSNSGTVSSVAALSFDVTEFENTGAVISGGDLDIYGDQIINEGGVIWANGTITLQGNADGDPAALVRNTNGRIEAFQGNLIITAGEILNIGTAPTLDTSTIISWLEEGSADPIIASAEINKLIDDAYLDANGQILPAHAEAYAALWQDLLTDPNNLSAEAQSILSDTVTTPSGTAIHPDFSALWDDMLARANLSGVVDPADAVLDLLDPSVLDGSGNVLPQHAEAYAELWQTLAAGGTTVSSDVQDILRDDAFVQTGSETDPVTGVVTPIYSDELNADTTGLWADMTAGSGAPYDILNILYQDRFNDDGLLAEMVAGQDVVLTATNVENRFGAISAGEDVSITADTILNQAIGASQFLIEVHKRPDCFTCHEGEVNFYDTFGGRIEANGALSITGSLTNETLLSSEFTSQEVTDLTNAYLDELRAEGDPLADDVPDVGTTSFAFYDVREDDEVAPVAGNGTDIQEITPVDTGTETVVDTGTDPVITLPVLPDLDQLLVEGINTLAETDPAFAEYSNFLTSNYMMDVDRLEYRDELVQNAFEATPGTVSTTGPLDIGAPDFLNQPIRIPAPDGSGIVEVFPAAAPIAISQDGALIAGDTVTIEGAAAVLNSGTITAGTDLTIDALLLQSDGGTFTAEDGTLDIDTSLGAIFEGGSVTGGSIDVSVLLGDLTIAGTELAAETDASFTAEFGNVVLTSQAVETEWDNWGASTDPDGTGPLFNTGTRTYSAVDQILTTVDVGGDLTITASNAITLAGVEAEIEGNATLDAGTDLILTATQSQTSANSSQGRSSTVMDTVTSHTTSLLVGGNLDADAGGDAVLVGTLIDTGGSVDLTADEIIAAAAQDSLYFNTQSSSRGFLSSRSSSTTITEVTNQGATISAGADVSLTATDGDMTLAGAGIDGGGDITLSATGDIFAGTYTDVFQETTTSSRSFLFGLISSSSSTSTVNQNATVTDLLSGADLALISDADTTLVGSALEAGGTLSITTGGDLSVEGAISSLQFSEFLADNGLVLSTTETTRLYEEYVQYASLVGGDIELSIGGIAAATLYARAGEEAPLPEDLFPEALLALEGLEFLNEELAYQYFHEETQSLSPAFKMLVSIAVGNFVTPALVGNIGFLSGAPGWVMTGVNSFVSNVIVESLDGVVSGDFDLGEILEGAALSGITAAATAGISEALFGGSPVFDEFGEQALDAAGDPIFTEGILSDFIDGLPTEGLLGFGTGNLSIASIVEGGIDNLISAGINSAVYGTDFGDNFLSAMTSTLVNLALADVQNEIGDLFTDENGDPINGGEGSIGHALLHGLAGCVAAELQEADCVAGAAGAIASSLYAGAIEGTDYDPEQASLIANTLGALAGFVFSGGEASNVTIAGAIALSGFQNNYLTHDQWSELIDAMAACEGDQACIDAVLDDYRHLSATQNAELAACIAAGDIACVQGIMSELRELDAEYASMIEELEAVAADAGITVNSSEELNDLFGLDSEGFHTGQVISFNPGQFDGSLLELYASFANQNCVAGSDCISEFSAYRQAQQDEFFEAVLGLAVDFTPLVGDVAGFVDCGTELSVASCLGAIASLVPLIGDGARIILRRGDEYVTVTRGPGGGTETRPSTPEEIPGPGLCSFHGDTLVLTDGGLLPIREVSTNMSVWSRDAANGDMAWQPVLAQYSNAYQETVYVTLRDEEGWAEQTITSNRIHPFFVQTARTVAASSEGHVYTGPLDNGHWIDAAELQPGDRLLNNDGTWAEVVGVEIEAQPLTAFNLTVEGFHTYFVAANENAAPVWVHNRCFNNLDDLEVEYVGTQNGRPVYDYIDPDTGEIRQVYQGTDGRFYDTLDHPMDASGAPTNVSQPSTGFDGLWEPNPKHDVYDSPPPTNPVETLRGSIELPGNTTRRVGYDPSTGEFAVFDEHTPGVFHGHIRPWSDLTQDMQNVLYENGIVDLRGNPQ